MDDKLKQWMFIAAFLLLLITLAYCFVCIWVKPVVDLSTPILGITMLLIGYYWGTSKSSADKQKNNAPIKAEDIEI